MEKKIEIVSEIESVITFNEITTDSINRVDVATAEERINVLLNEIQERNEEIEKLKLKIEYAKKIIALADEKKLSEQV